MNENSVMNKRERCFHFMLTIYKFSEAEEQF